MTLPTCPRAGCEGTGIPDFSHILGHQEHSAQHYFAHKAHDPLSKIAVTVGALGYHALKKKFAEIYVCDACQHRWTVVPIAENAWAKIKGWW